MENKYDKKYGLKKGPKIVVLGGGTGLSILLQGLKKYSDNISAIVTVADDGGGSGVLREDLGMLPPGDIRACLLALANTEPTMEKLLNYRFSQGSLEGQSFGNLFIAAMVGITGSFENAIKEASNVLAITGKVYPMTLEDVRLVAELENGLKVVGESRIPIVAKIENQNIKKMFLLGDNIAQPVKESVEAIEDADFIILGPGSLYTSIIPNLLVKDINEKIYNSKAKKIYISNIMTQPGETDGYNVLDHVEALIKHSSRDFLDYVLINKENIPKKTLELYEADDSYPVIIDNKQIEKLDNYGIKTLKMNLLDIEKNYIRHDSEKIGEKLVEIWEK